jgi:hypothetical protein
MDQPPPPFIRPLPFVMTHSAYLVLQLEQLVVQIEEHMNPSLVGHSFIVVFDPPSMQTEGGVDKGELHHTDLDSLPLGVSAEALRQGVRQNMSMREILVHFPAVMRVAAAAWRAPPSTPVLEAYRNLAERGPVQVLRRVVTGDGLKLVDDSKYGRLGQYSVHIQSTNEEKESESSSSSISVFLEQAKELGSFLQAELARLLGYRLIFGVGRTVEEARRNAKGLLLFRLKKPLGKRDATTVVDHAHADNHDAKEGTEMLSPAEGERHKTNARCCMGRFHLEDEKEEHGPVRLAEFICQTCKACFLNAVELLDHVQKEHEQDSSFQTKRMAARVPTRQSPYLSLETPTSSDCSSKAKERLRDMRAASCLKLIPTSTPQLRPQGPGIVTMSEILATLRTTADITTFLCEIGAPLVHLPGWPPPPVSQEEQEAKK